MSTTTSSRVEPAEPVIAEPSKSPVFVLTTSRSGSTLLRFILDSHPDLACPPETSFAAAAAQLARTWDVLENAGSESKPVDGTWQPSPAVAIAVRQAIDQAYGHYLLRRRKSRWCDKSLDTHQYADLIGCLYPDAKFICLYRHCMDVIASGIDVCPFGLTRFGFDPYVLRHPGNSVAAIGSYWLEAVQMIMTFEEQNPNRCLRVRYEDLATAPERTASAIFAFVGVPHIPGITRSCFTTPHEANGPGDEKIWFTKAVTSDSLGRGVRILSDALPTPIRDGINGALSKLGYRIVDDNWNSVSEHIDPRADTDTVVSESVASRCPPQDSDDAHAAMRAIRDRIDSQADEARHEIIARWPGLSGQTVRIVVVGADSLSLELQWTFQVNSDVDGTRTPNSREPVATLLASAATWQSLLDDQANIVTELLSGRLRSVNKRDKHRLRSNEIHAISVLLGLGPVPIAREDSSE